MLRNCNIVVGEMLHMNFEPDMAAFSVSWAIPYFNTRECSCFFYIRVCILPYYIDT